MTDIQGFGLKSPSSLGAGKSISGIINVTDITPPVRSRAFIVESSINISGFCSDDLGDLEGFHFTNGVGVYTGVNGVHGICTMNHPEASQNGIVRITHSPRTIQFSGTLRFGGTGLHFTLPFSSEVIPLTNFSLLPTSFNAMVLDVRGNEAGIVTFTNIEYKYCLSFYVQGNATFIPNGNESLSCDAMVLPSSNNLWKFESGSSTPWTGSNYVSEISVKYQLNYDSSGNKWIFEISRDHVICRFVLSGNNPQGTYVLDYTTENWNDIGCTNFNCSGITVEITDYYEQDE